MRPECIYEFAGHSLDLRRGRLLRGREEVALRPKAMALLVFLLENPGRVVDKEELIAAVWPKTIVTDDSLSQCLKDVRIALGSAAEGFIRTVPRRGYIVDPETIQSRSQLPVGVSAKPSIAVLAFRPLASDREHHWFAEGLSDDIATALTRSRHLTVISRLARPADPSMSAIDAAKALGVRYAVDGSVRLAGERLRVSAQLLDAVSGTILWSGRFDRNHSDVFAIQDEITEAVVRHLELELLPDERQSLQLSRTGNVEAYTYYRHGWQIAHHWTRQSLLVARRLFSRAIEFDGSYAQAYAALALTDCYLLDWFAPPSGHEAILATASKALTLDPKLAEAHVAVGAIFHRTNRNDEAAEAFARAIDIDPNSYEARLFAGHLAWTTGDRELARARFVEAARLRCDDYLSPYLALGMMSRCDPDRLAWAQLAFERLERVIALQPENPAPLARAAVVLVHLRKEAQAFSWIHRALTIDPEDPVTCYNAAAVYSLSGDQETALYYLDATLQRSSEVALAIIRYDGDLDALRSHPGYEAALARRAISASS